jgi:replicative DNA helicase
MINQEFLHACYLLCFNKHSTISKTPELYSNILNILEIYKKTSETPLFLKNNFDLLEILIREMIEENDFEKVVLKINWSGKFKELYDYIELIRTNDVEEDDFQKYSKLIHPFLFIATIYKDYPLLEKLISKFHNNEFEKKEEEINFYTEAISTLFKNLSDAQMLASNLSSSSFSTDKNGFDNTMEVMKAILNNHKPKRKVSTGFKMIDDYVLSGGFSPKNVYVFAGASKSGKSTLLSNLFLNSLKKQYEEPKLMVFISLENTLIEFSQRMISTTLNIKIKDLLKKLNTNIEDVYKLYNEIIYSYPNIPGFEYKASKSLSISEIPGVLQTLSQKHNNLKIGALFVDYLYHIRPSNSKVELRHQLGDMIVEMKNLATKFDIPVITATQLNRTVVKAAKPTELDVRLVGESHLITCHTDGLFLMARDTEDENIVHFNSGVQRSGKSDVPLVFSVDFDKFKFEDLKHFKNSSKSSDISQKENDLMKIDFNKLDKKELIPKIKKVESYFSSNVI